MTASATSNTSTKNNVERATSGRVLQLNSTVVAGFAGAKSSTFPMQALGLDVDCIYSTQHSNHSGYAHVAKSDIPRETLDQLFDGLVQNDLLAGRYDCFFSGFIADEVFLHDVCEWYQKLKAVNPHAKWFCDTVIGDRDSKTGKEIYYCPKALVPLFRELVLPLADVITPNQLELELLSEAKSVISTRQEAIDAMKILHARGVGTIVLTSVDTEFGSEMLVSTMDEKQQQKQSVFQASFQPSPHHFTGTGDCIMGLLVGNMFRTPDDMPLASSRSLSSMQAIVQRTVDSLPSSSSKDAKSDGSDASISPQDDSSSKSVELKIVQSLTDIIQPRETHSFVSIQ